MRILTDWEKQELINKLKNLTDENQHNESRLLLTKELMLNDLYKFYCECAFILDEIVYRAEEEIHQEWLKKRAIADKFLWTITPEYYNCF